ncbi:MAG: R3H domain-containing nucleic acid-binding protein [Bryobacteraceae bacterium]
MATAEGQSSPRYRADDLAPRLEAFLKPLLRAAGFELQFEVAEGAHAHPDFEDPDVVVRFRGPDVDILLENRAEVLLALEHLAMEVLAIPAEAHSLLCFDANDYRILRIEELRLSAVTAAEKVKRTRAPFHFNPMSSRERRIIHLSLRNETDVRSESTGAGPYRQVVVVPADMKEIPAPIMPPPSFRGGGERGGERRFGGPGRRDEGRRPSGPPRGGRRRPS